MFDALNHESFATFCGNHLLAIIIGLLLVGWFIEKVRGDD